jgi:hypothetical protein
MPTQRFGPVTWVVLGVIAVGGICWYRKQPPERRERIKEVALDIGTRMMDEYQKATTEIQQARVQLHACVVPRREHRTPESAMLRELAMSEESLSPQQITDLLDPSLRPPVAEIPTYLMANYKTLFAQVRRGGFVLGHHYTLPDS